MIKHTIEISARPALLTLRNKQLCIKSGQGDEAVLKTYACEDMGVVILQHPAISIVCLIMAYHAPEFLTSPVGRMDTFLAFGKFFKNEPSVAVTNFIFGSPEEGLASV